MDAYGRWVLALFFAVGCAPQAEWTQWRGPQRDGIAVGFTVPEKWPEALDRRWQVEVGGGQATPLVKLDRIYVASRLKGREGLTCLDRRTGEVIWRSDEGVEYKIAHQAAEKVGKGPKSTPVLHRRLIYTVGIDGLLICRRIDNGATVWRRDFKGEFQFTSPVFGASSSPLIAGGALIVHVGGQDRGALRAFELETGKVRWSWDEPPSYASPVLLTLGGVEQLVVPTQNHIAGLSVDDGRLLWKIPFKTPYDETAPTPVGYGQDMVIFGGLERGMRGVRVVAGEAGWQVEEVWHNPDGAMYLNSPLLHGDQVLGFSHLRKGQFFCFAAASGQTLWQSPGRQAESAALVDVGSAWLALTTDGELLVLDKTAGQYAPQRRYKVAESETWAHPVPLEEGILVRDLNFLTLWGLD